MNTDNPLTDTTAAERREELVRRMRADKDARIQAHRQRPLPAWLASPGSRRAIALLPVVPLVGGLIAATMPDTIARSTLMLAVTAVCVITILLLRQTTRLLDAVPDRLLDEREIGQRDNAYRRAHGIVVGLLALIAAVAIADGTSTKLTGAPLVTDGGWVPLTVTAILVGTMVPAAVVAWRWVEPPADAIDD